MGAIAWSFTAAVIGWLTLEFIGRPFRKFFDLRGEIISRLAQFSNVKARRKEIPDDVGAVSGNREEMSLSEEEIERLHEAENVLRGLASQLRAFALNETFGGRAVRLLGYDPLTASGGLFGISNSLDTYSGERRFHRETIAKALRVDVNMI
jgi:hypothetical protein